MNFSVVRRCIQFRSLHVLMLLTALTACGGGGSGSGNVGSNSGPVGTDCHFSLCQTTYDFEKNGMPTVIEKHHIDYSKVVQITRFRSALGHDAADDFESCRNMKHYYRPTELVPIYAPVTGTVINAFAENDWGTQVRIVPTSNTAVDIGLFHLVTKIKIGDSVVAGQLLGTHASLETGSDIAVLIHTPQGTRSVSVFDVMPDNLFAELAQYGITSRSQMIISKAARDANPLLCDTVGGSFLNQNYPQFPVSFQSTSCGLIYNAVNLPSGAYDWCFDLDIPQSVKDALIVN